MTRSIRFKSQDELNQYLIDRLEQVEVRYWALYSAFKNIADFAAEKEVWSREEFNDLLTTMLARFESSDDVSESQKSTISEAFRGLRLRSDDSVTIGFDVIDGGKSDSE